MDKELFKRCSDKIEDLFKIGGLPSGLHYDYAEKCCELYLKLSKDVKEQVIEEDAEIRWCPLYVDYKKSCVALRDRETELNRTA